MGFQALAFFFAFALPLLMVERISSSGFKGSTALILAIIAGALGALPLFLVRFSGAFGTYIQIIQLAYLVYALLVVTLTGYLSSVANKRVGTPLPATVEVEDTPSPSDESTKTE